MDIQFKELSVPGWISGSGNRRYTSGRDGLRPQIDMIMERGILYTSFSLFIGVLFFNLIMYKGNATSVRSRSKNIIWISLFGILISLLFNLPLQAKINADVSWLEAFNPLLLKETLQLSVLVMYGLLKWFSLVRL